jgi:two-component system chemotaxis response regulator CheB
MKKTTVLVVDDSATIRRLLTEILSRDPEIEVVGQAPEPAVARQMIKELNPDVITLDIEMPNMNGLDFLEKIMRLRPMPVVMVSTLTQRGAEATIEALELGAVDYHAKPTDNVAVSLVAGGAELAAKVKMAARAHVRARVAAPSKKTRPAAPFKDPGASLIAIGASTGGVEALIEVLSHFPENCPPTVITQHMPEHFTASFAARLDRICAPKVAEATEGAPLSPGHVYLAPGGRSHLEVAGIGVFRCKLSEGEAVSGHLPSVDVLFHSVARCAGRRAIGVILTGMGRDGAKGLAAMRQAGGMTLGQDEASCVVYGMPRAAFEAGAVERQMPLEKLGPEIIRQCGLRSEGVQHARSI